MRGEAGPGWAVRGEAVPGWAWQGNARQGYLFFAHRNNGTVQGDAMRGMARPGRAVRGEAVPGWAWQGNARQGYLFFAPRNNGTVQGDAARGNAWRGHAGQCNAWPGRAMRGYLFFAPRNNGTVQGDARLGDAMRGEAARGGARHGWAMRGGAGQCDAGQGDAMQGEAISMKIGFTGTRTPIPDEQRDSLGVLLRVFSGKAEGVEECHQGCCVGADEVFARLASELKWRMVGHPCDLEQFVSPIALALCDELREPDEPLRRNWSIVSAVDILVACPAGPEEQRSGTWATVRRARRQYKAVWLVWPDGNITKEGSGWI